MIRRKDKKAITAVVATALLIVVAVVSVIGFQSWFGSFSSKTFVNVEQNSKDTNSNSQIETLVGDNLYFKNNLEDNLSIKEIKVNGKVCNISVTNLSLGVGSISLENCTDNLTTNVADVTIITEKKIFNKKVFLKDIEVVSLPSTPSITCANVTTGLVGLWHMDNNWSDSSGNGYDGQTPVQTVTVDNYDSTTGWNLRSVSGSASSGVYHASILSVFDPGIYKNIPDFSSKYDVIEFRYKNYLNGPKSITIYYTDGADCSGYSESCKVAFSVENDTLWHTVKINVTSPNWIDYDANINNMRIDFDTATSTGIFDIDYIKVSYSDPEFNSDTQVGSHSGDFNGISDYVSTPNIAPMPEFTVSYWCKTNSILTDRNCYVSKYRHIDDLGTDWVIGINNGIVGFSSWQSDFTYKYISYNYTSLYNTWNNIAVSFDSSNTKRLYVNGVEVNSSVEPEDVDTHTQPIDFGVYYFYHSSNRKFTNGLVDDVVLYDRALSDSELQEIYQAGSNGNSICGY